MGVRAHMPADLYNWSKEVQVCVAGCLVVYCAGCALKIEARLQRVAEAFSYSLERPFVGMFTYGEQFRTRAGANQHANLMYAVLAFGD